MILLCLIVFLSTLSLVFYHKQKKIFAKVEHIPGPPMLPFLGNALEFGTNSVDILRNFKRLSEKYGPVVRLCVGWKVCILLSEPTYILQAVKLTSDEQMHEFFKYIQPLSGRGLLTLTGKIWNRHRRIINRFFSAKHLEKYTAIANKNGNKLISKLETMVGPNTSDITYEIFSCILNITCNVVMQTDVTENKAYLEAADGMLDLSVKRFISIPKKIDMFYRFTNDFKLLQVHMKTLDDFHEGVLAKHKMNIISEEEAANKGAIIDELLSLKDEDALTHEEIRGEIQTLIAAGAETTGTTLTFLLFELAKHRDVQRKILEETQHILGPNRKSDVTFEDLHQLKYTECVIKETLRLYSPAHVFPKVLGEETKFGNMTIPAGADILLYFGAMHLSPDYFANPKQFLPERFLSENSKENHAFMPFSVGPKMCVGHKFAMLETKVLVVKLVRNFEFFPVRPEHHLVLKYEGVLKSGNGVPVIVKFRE